MTCSTLCKHTEHPSGVTLAITQSGGASLSDGAMSSPLRRYQRRFKVVCSRVNLFCSPVVLCRGKAPTDHDRLYVKLSDLIT
jgi:hypothetical protein